MNEHGRREIWKEKGGGGGGGEENCNREMRGGIDGFIRQDDTEVRCTTRIVTERSEEG